MMMEASDEAFAKDLDLCNEYVKWRMYLPIHLVYLMNGMYLLRSKGFVLAFTTETGLNNEQTDPLHLKRNAVP